MYENFNTSCGDGFLNVFDFERLLRASSRQRKDKRLTFSCTLILSRRKFDEKVKANKGSQEYETVINENLCSKLAQEILITLTLWRFLKK